MIPLEQLRESSIYKHILQEGEQKGREEGKLEGRIEGKVEEVRSTLNKLIAKRFVGLNLQKEIESINDLSVLEELCLQVIDAVDAEQMRSSVVETAANKDSSLS